MRVTNLPSAITREYLQVMVEPYAIADPFVYHHELTRSPALRWILQHAGNPVFIKTSCTSRINKSSQITPSRYMTPHDSRVALTFLHLFALTSNNRTTAGFHLLSIAPAHNEYCFCLIKT